MPSQTNNPSNQIKKAYVYLLWAVGGPWGLHHIYLGRYNQAFLWWATCGGFFGLGWIRDIWRIPEYVADVNEETSYLERLIRRMKKFQTPPLSIPRLAAEFFFAMSVGIATIAGLPSEYTEGTSGMIVRCSVLPLAVALAVNMVANIGREKASMKWTLIGAYITIPLFIANFYHPGSNLSHCSLAASIFTNWKGKSWRKTKTLKKSRRIHCLVLLIAACLYVSLWFSALFNNAYVTTSDGVKVRLKDSFGNIKESQAWKEPLDTLRIVFGTYGANGFHSSWRSFVNAMDPEGELNSYQILGISPGASEKEIRKAYRQKSLRFHPDANDAGATEQFMVIQKAYDTLSSVRARRAKANQKDRDKEEYRPL